MELVAVAIVLLVSSALAGVAARALMALTFFLLMRSSTAAVVEINSQLPTSNSPGSGLAASV